MKSKKIERLEKELRELATEIQYPDVVNRMAQIKREIKATRNRNLWAREKHAAMTSLGLIRVRSITGKVYYE